MVQPKPAIGPNSSQVLVRFAFRLVLLSTFATFSTQVFGTVFSALLVLSALFCAFVGMLRREAIFSPVFTHWDEAATCAVLGHLIAVLLMELFRVLAILMPRL